jgi:hypothetical protein
MTSSLRMKRQITRRERSSRVRTVISSTVLGLVLAASPSLADQSVPAAPPAGKTLYFGRQPTSSAPVPAPPTLPVAVPDQPLTVMPPATSPFIPDFPPAAPPASNTFIPDSPRTAPSTDVTPPALPTPQSPFEIKSPGRKVTGASHLSTGASGFPVPKGAPLIQPLRAQIPPAGIAKEQAAEKVYDIDFEFPSLEKWTQPLESESAMKERIRQKARTYRPLETVIFPAEIVLTKEREPVRQWQLRHEVAEPNYVCYQRTYFDQINFERYGWDLGPVTPVVSAGKFFFDVALLPYHMGTDPCRHCECNAGWCMPGDPVPLLCYPPHFSITGLAAEASVIAGGFFVFP